jgi:hypothetical protein
MDEGKLSVPLSAEYPSNKCCLLQDVVERSRQRSEMLQGYGDTVLRAESLEKELAKARKHSAMLQSKLDGAFFELSFAGRWIAVTVLSSLRLRLGPE